MSRKISPRGAVPVEVRKALEAAINRCQSKRERSERSYAGRGITVCDEWRGDMGSLRFYEHIGPMPGPGYTVDRVDNARGYEPGNVRWATWVEQQNNRRSNVRVRVGDTSQTLAQWARQTGIARQLITTRRNCGWAIAVAVVTPVGVSKAVAHEAAGILPVRETDKRQPLKRNRSRKRGLNSRPPAYEAGALPLSYSGSETRAK